MPRLMPVNIFWLLGRRGEGETVHSRMRSTLSNAEDSGAAAGWSIGNARYITYTGDRGWRSPGGSDRSNLRFAVYGEVRDPVVNSPPIFSSSSSFLVNENVRRVVTVVASDSDVQDSVTGYSVSGGVDSARFSITSGGVLSFRSAPDYERPVDSGTNGVYNLVVTATSGTGGRVRTATQIISVTVQDVAEAPSAPGRLFLSSPSSNSLLVSWSVPSNTGPSLSDYDVGYGMNSNGPFTDWPHSGVGRSATITGLNASTLYYVRVRAGNAEGVGSWSPTANFTVRDVGEAPSAPSAPSLSSPSSTSLFVSWSAPSNTGPPISDYDVGYGMNSNGPFTDWPHSGVGRSATIIGLNASTLYYVRVLARNGEGDSGWSPTANFTTGTTVTNNPPVFSSSSSFSVNENSDDAGRLVASDPNNQDSVTGYSVSGGVDSARFFTNGGFLSFRFLPDYERPADSGRNNVYNVVVTATSGTGGRVRTATQSITVTVRDVDEAPSVPSAPSLSSPSSTSLLVSWSAPFNVGPAISDYDVGYGLSSSGPFTDWSHLGNSTTATITGLNASTLYYVRVRAGNAEGDSGWSPTANFTTGTTVTNNPPVFSSSSSFSVNEHSDDVGRLVASDPNNQDSVTGYSVSGGVDSARFFTNGGSLSFRFPPDYERPADSGRNNVYNVVVTATSGTGGRVRTATQSITVTVRDVDEPPSVPSAPSLSSPSSTSLFVSWSAPFNVGPAISDYDVGYGLSSSGPFTDWSHLGNSTTATITGLNASTLYYVRVRAGNAEGDSSWSPAANFTTGSTSVTNDPPVFSSGSSFLVNENVRGVGIVVASDRDGLDSVSGYRVSGGVDSAFFSITSGGVLTFNSVPNYESPQDGGTDNVYALEVEASSGVGGRVRTATQSIRVTVVDVAEAPSAPGRPVLSSPNSTSLLVSWPVPSNTGPSILDYGVQYREGTSGTFSNWSHSDASRNATITGLNVSTLYYVRVLARNAEGSSGWSPTASFTTGSVVNTPPVFSSSSSFSVNENTFVVGTVVASDNDGQDNVTGYRVSGGADSGRLLVRNGDLLVFRFAPDYESPVDSGGDNVYNVVVTASSGVGGRVRTATQSVVVTVVDVVEVPSAPGDAVNFCE